MKRIIINEDALKNINIKDIIFNKDLHNDLKDALKNNKTSLGDNPAIPKDINDSFLEKITKKRFEEAKNSVLPFEEEFNDFDDFNNKLSHIYNICQEIEEPFKDKIEKMVYNIIVDLFNPPEGVVNMYLELVDEISDNDITIRVKTEDSNDFEYDDETHREYLLNEVYKRRFIDALIIGAATRISMDKRIYLSDVYEINRKLPELYEMALKLNDYFLFTNGEVKITDNKKYQLGISSVLIGNDSTKTEIRAKGMIFPILLFESVRACLEVFAAHGLPKDKNEALYVMNKADFLQAEQWDMRIGPAMWDCFVECLGDCDSNMIPYILTEYFKLPVDKFNILSKEMLIKSKKAKRIFKNIKEKISNNIDYDDFSNRLIKKNDNIAIINDEYIHPNEL